jgi:hypothetical protein
MELSGNKCVRLWVPYCGDSVEITKHLIKCAEECLGWAETAKSDHERKAFVGMARAWLDAAASRFAAVAQTPPRDAAQPGDGRET